MPAPPRQSPEIGPVGLAGPPGRTRSGRQAVADAAREIIREAGDAVPRSDLFRALAERGVVIQGAEPEKTLSTMLWRTRDRVVHVRGGYWIAGVPNLKAGYDPATDDKEARSTMEANLISLSGEQVSELEGD